MGPGAQINGGRFLWRTYITCVMGFDCHGITSEAKECACIICVQRCNLRPTGTGLIASLESELSFVHCFERQDVLQMKNVFTFYCTKNPAVHLSGIHTHLPLLFLSFPPSWHSSWSTFWWKALWLSLSLISFPPLFLIKKRQEDSLSSLKAFWLELWLFFKVAALEREQFSFLFLFFSLSIQSRYC